MCWPYIFPDWKDGEEKADCLLAVRPFCLEKGMCELGPNGLLTQAAIAWKIKGQFWGRICCISRKGNKGSLELLQIDIQRKVSLEQRC